MENHRTPAEIEAMLKVMIKAWDDDKLEGYANEYVLGWINALDWVFYNDSKKEE